jgi:hypothetical protein
VTLHVLRFARTASPEELLVHDGTGRRASILDEHAAYLRDHWNSGCIGSAVDFPGTVEEMPRF